MMDGFTSLMQRSFGITLLATFSRSRERLSKSTKRETVVLWTVSFLLLIKKENTPVRPRPQLSYHPVRSTLQRKDSVGNFEKHKMRGLFGVFPNVYLTLNTERRFSMKGIKFLGICILVMGLVLAINQQALAQKVTTLKLAHGYPIPHTRNIVAQKMAELTQNYSQGGIRIEIYPAAQLYRAKEELDALIMGSVDITLH